MNGREPNVRATSKGELAARWMRENDESYSVAAARFGLSKVAVYLHFKRLYPEVVEARKGTRSR